MTKKLLACFIIICLLMPSLSYANTPIMDGTPIIGTVFLDDFEITFSSPPIYFRNYIMVPARAMFEKLGIQIYWIEGTKELLAYRDNVFLKIQIGNSLAYVNGKETDMGLEPLLRNGELFIPVTFIANVFDLNYTLDKSKHGINLDFRENLYEYEQFNGQHYKKINTINWGISFFVPEYWEKVEGTYSTYGVDNDYEYFKFEPRVLPLDSTFNRSILAEALVTNLKYQYGSRIKDVHFSDRLFGEFLCRMVTYTFNDNGVMKKRFMYVLFENNNGYIFDGEVNDLVSFEDAQTVFDTILGTFQISKLTVDESSEHYLELAKFFEVGMKLDSKIYSNMEVDNQFQISGTVAEDSKVEGLHIVVSKGNEKTEYYAPVVANAFKANIFTPFGLGKHNITIMVEYADDSAPKSSEEMLGLTLDEIVNKATSLEMPIDAKKVIMKFSVINLSNDAIKFLLPSDYINYDNNAVYQQVNSLTYNLTNDYSKAKTVYEWLSSNYSYEPVTESAMLSTTVEMLGKTSGTEVDLAILYTGLMRSMNIPARIVRGTNEQMSHYWAETFINGRWIVTDIGWEVRYKDDQSQKSLKYFNINLIGHYSQFKKTEFLPF